jgi:hypothetical protein
VDEIIEIELGEDIDMDASGLTLRDIFFNQQGTDRNRLLDAIEKTSTGGTYRFVLHQSKSEEVDKMLEHIDDILNSIGDWDEFHIHSPLRPINKY